MKLLTVLLLAATALLAACTLAGCASLQSSDQNLLGLVTPYRIEIVQGNVVTREQAAAIAACGDDRHALGIGGVGGAIDVGDRVIVDQPDHLVLKQAEASRAAPAIAVGF